MSWEESVYLLSRAALCVLALSVAWITARYALDSARATGRRGRVGFLGAALLAVAGILSAYDGIDNVLLRPQDPILPMSWVWFSVFDVAVPIYAWLLIRSLRARNTLLVRLHELSVTDPLTGALNRRGFFKDAARAVALARRSGRPAVLAALDLDHFKSVNDAYGHGAGDALLKAVVASVRAGARQDDVLGRLGGDEFVMLTVGSDITDAVRRVRRLADAVERSIAAMSGGSKVGVSAGLAAVEPFLPPQSAVERAVVAADRALYKAKQAGKGRIEIADSTAGG